MSASSGDAIPDHADKLKARREGMRCALGIPGVSIFGTMLGFAAIAREAGFDLSMTLATTFLVWGMPGQVAMVTLHAAGASALVIFTAVALANMRMLLMTVSGMAIMGQVRMPCRFGGVSFWRRCWRLPHGCRSAFLKAAGRP